MSFAKILEKKGINVKLLKMVEQEENGYPEEIAAFDFIRFFL